MEGTVTTLSYSLLKRILNQNIGFYGLAKTGRKPSIGLSLILFWYSVDSNGCPKESRFLY